MGLSKQGGYHKGGHIRETGGMTDAARAAGAIGVIKNGYGLFDKSFGENSDEPNPIDPRISSIPNIAEFREKMNTDPRTWLQAFMCKPDGKIQMLDEWNRDVFNPAGMHAILCHYHQDGLYAVIFYPKDVYDSFPDKA